MSLLPLFHPILSNLYSEINTDMRHNQVEIYTELSKFKKNIENYDNSESGSENVYEFDLEYNKSVIWFIEMNYTEFNFILHEKSAIFPSSYIIRINRKINVSSESLFFNKYSILMQNSTIFLIFF